MKSLFKIIENLFDSRITQIIFLPIVLYNTIQSWKMVKKEHSIFETTINSNDDFFKAIATMNFTPDENTKYVLSSEMEVDKIFTTQEVQTIAKETIIKTIMQYVRDEELLGIVLVKCEFTNNNETVKISIIPAHLQMLENDKQDLEQSIRLNFFLFIIGLCIYLGIRFL